MALEIVATFVLVAGTLIGAIGYQRLFRSMEIENPRLYRDLGRPSLGRTSLKTRRLVQRYIWSQRGRSGVMGRLSRFLIGYLVVFLLTLLMLAVFLILERV